jgi:predicted nucleotidyltransferase
METFRCRAPGHRKLAVLRCSDRLVDVDLQAVLDALKTHEVELRGLGVQHAAVFGSLVRGEAHPGSDIDILIDLDPERPIGVFGATPA